MGTEACQSRKGRNGGGDYYKTHRKKKISEKEKKKGLLEKKKEDAICESEYVDAGGDGRPSGRYYYGKKGVDWAP